METKDIKYLISCLLKIELENNLICNDSLNEILIKTFNGQLKIKVSKIPTYTN